MMWRLSGIRETPLARQKNTADDATDNKTKGVTRFMSEVSGSRNWSHLLEGQMQTSLV